MQTEEVPPPVYVLENGEVFIKCSHDKCHTFFAKVGGTQELLPPPISNEDKYSQILAGIINTKMFCLLHSIEHTQTICRDSKIPLCNPEQDPILEKPLYTCSH